jgi:hypothetical protein
MPVPATADIGIYLLVSDVNVYVAAAPCSSSGAGQLSFLQGGRKPVRQIIEHRPR